MRIATYTPKQLGNSLRNKFLHSPLGKAQESGLLCDLMFSEPNYDESGHLDIR